MVSAPHLCQPFTYDFHSFLQILVLNLPTSHRCMGKDTIAASATIEWWLDLYLGERTFRSCIQTVRCWLYQYQYTFQNHFLYVDLRPRIYFPVGFIRQVLTDIEKTRLYKNSLWVIKRAGAWIPTGNQKHRYTLPSTYKLRQHLSTTVLLESWRTVIKLDLI